MANNFFFFCLENDTHSPLEISFHPPTGDFCLVERSIFGVVVSLKGKRGDVKHSLTKFILRAKTACVTLALLPRTSQSKSTRENLISDSNIVCIVLFCF